MATSRSAHMPRGSAPDAFFLGASIVLLAIVIIGFAPSLYMRFAFETPPIPLYLHLHGIILTGWFVLLILQAGLVQTGKTALHQKIGYFVAAYAAVVVAGSLMATFNAVPRELASGMTFETNMAEVDASMGGDLTFLSFISGVVWANILSVVGFAVLIVLAVLYRRNPQVHKRLIVIATVGMMGPPLARISRAELLGGEQGPFIPLAILSLLLLVLVHDKISIGRLHPASLAASIFTALLMFSGGFVAQSEFGLEFVRGLGES